MHVFWDGNNHIQNLITTKKSNHLDEEDSFSRFLVALIISIKLEDESSMILCYNEATKANHAIYREQKFYMLVTFILLMLLNCVLRVSPLRPRGRIAEKLLCWFTGLPEVLLNYRKNMSQLRKSWGELILTPRENQAWWISFNILNNKRRGNLEHRIKSQLNTLWSKFLHECLKSEEKCK